MTEAALFVETNSMTDAALTTAPAGSAIDLDLLDGTLSNLRRASRTAADAVAALTEARDRLVVAPADAEAAWAARMASLQMRADAAGLAEQFTALAQVREGAP